MRTRSAPSAGGMKSMIASLSCRPALRRGCELHDPDPATIDHPATSLGRRWANRGPPICDFFPKKIESDLDQKLRATAWRH